MPHTIALMIESDGPGGAELVLLRLAGALRARGKEVVPVLPAGRVGWLGEKLRADGFAPEALREGRPPDPRFLVRLARALRRRRVDLVHSHEFTMCVYGAAAAQLLRRPHVATIHGADAMNRARRRRLAIRWAFGASQAVTTVSDATRRKLAAELRFAHARIEVVPNGVPVRPGDAAAGRAALGVRPEEVLVVAVGSLEVHKGHAVLLEALARLAREGLRVPWRLAIAGGRGGPEREKLERFAAEHGMGDRVRVLGYRDDVPDLLAAADVFAMPSLWEGLPLALLEAMGAGTAIVASGIAGIPEAIASGEHGLLVPPGDPAALAVALRRLFESPALRARLAQAARERAHAEFTLDAMTRRYEGVYARAAAARAGAPGTPSR